MSSESAESSTDALALVSSICWTLLHCLTAWINPAFQVLVSTTEVLTHLLVSAHLTFCHGLKEVLSAPTPPPIRWFQQFDPHIPKDSWGIYLMVLEKDSHKPGIYIGSSVAVRQGIQARILEHKRGHKVPFRVKQLKDEGYRIVHIAILTYMQILTPPNGTPR